MSNIYSAISSCMSEIGAISKGKKNQQQGFAYRGIDDVMNALQPVLIKNHVFAVPEVLDEKREERSTKSGGTLTYTILKIKYTFYADDGSSVEAIVLGEGMDSGDKSSNKAMAIAFKYACFQVFCIPTEEMPDPDAETPEPSKPKASASSAPPAASPEHKKMTREEALLDLKEILIHKFGGDYADMLFAITGYKDIESIPNAQLGIAIKKVKSADAKP